MNADDIAKRHPTKYLSFDDLGGRSPTLKIESAEFEEADLPKGKEWRTIVRFEGVAKPLVNNTTNDYSMAVLLGRKPSSWIGKRITLTPSSTTSPEGVIPCVRVAGSPDAEPARAERYKAILAQVEEMAPNARATGFASKLKYALAEIDPPRKEAKK